MIEDTSWNKKRLLNWTQREVSACTKGDHSIERLAEFTGEKFVEISVPGL